MMLTAVTARKLTRPPVGGSHTLHATIRLAVEREQ